MLRNSTRNLLALALPMACLSLNCSVLDNVGTGATDSPADTARPVDDGTGAMIFATLQNTIGGTSAACANCHGPDGSGDIGPDIRGESGGHLTEHAQGAGRHPDGIKFPDLTPADFDAIALFLGGQPGGGEDDEEDDAAHENLPPGDPARGEMIFTTEHDTISGAVIFCASCHGRDGASGFAPDIRGEPGPHLREHAQGDGRHPDGIKFPDLMPQDFEDIAAFLAGDGESVSSQ